MPLLKESLCFPVSSTCQRGLSHSHRHLSLLPHHDRLMQLLPLTYQILYPDPASQYSIASQPVPSKLPSNRHECSTTPLSQALFCCALKCAFPSPHTKQEPMPAWHTSLTKGVRHSNGCLSRGSVLVGPGAESTEPLPYPSCPPGHHPVTHSQAAGANHSTTGPDKGILYHLSSLREVVGSGGGM